MHVNMSAVVKRVVIVVVLASTVGVFAQKPTPAPQPSPAAPPPAVSGEAKPTTAMPQSTAAPETQSLHIQVGRSVIISTQARLRRILVSNPGVLDTVTISPTQLVVSAKTSGSSSLVLWDETGHARILDVSADVDVTGLREALSLAFPDQPIQVQGEEGRIVLSGTVADRATADEAVKMAAAYSKDVVDSMIAAPTPRGKQIMLKVRFAEVDRAKLAAFGINIFSTGAANTPGQISTQQFTPFTSPSIQGRIPGQLQGFSTQFSATDLLNIFVFRPDLNLGATIKALQSDNILQILAEPNLMALSGVQARFIAGGEFPFPVVQGGAVNAVTIQFRPFGVRLDFTGTIEPDNVIRLKVAPEVSALDFANAVTVSGFTVPAISTRRAETEIELRDGQSFGIAGLLDNRTTAQFSKIPGIGDIPILGNLFKSRQVSRSNTELLVLVTPVIADPVGGQVPAGTQGQVPTMPLKNLDIEKYDRKLPEGGKTPPATKK